MLNRFINTIRHIASHSGFEAYYHNIQRAGRDGFPTVEQAKKDYQAMVHCETIWGR
ncbi:MAG: hypothetical protein L0177_09445 [Chloroflexi bacterium]|nr:hypothetical protein [Chloroflexota bacterium]